MIIYLYGYSNKALGQAFAPPTASRKVLRCGHAGPTRAPPRVRVDVVSTARQRHVVQEQDKASDPTHRQAMLIGSASAGLTG